MKASTFRRLLNIWPPFLFAGISVRSTTPDFRDVMVCLRPSFFTRTGSGAHFGGSLFAMTDPFYALMLARGLGRGYTIWDRRSTIDFRSPGRGTVTARFILDEATIEEVRAAAADGQRVFRDFSVDIFDAKGHLVASVAKTIYIRKTTAPQA